MSMRATIIKVPDSAPGLLIAGDQQRAFTLEHVWRSPVAPALNMAVEVELDERGGIAAIRVLDTHALKQAVAETRLSIARNLEEQLTAFCAAKLTAFEARQQAQHEERLWWDTYNAVLSGLAAQHGLIDSNAYETAAEVANNTHGVRRLPTSVIAAMFRPERSFELT